MLKAEQQQFVQATNNQLLDIRSTEISYFIDFFSNFGTQCALISGFLLNAVSQVPGLDATCNIFFKYLYWITTAISLIFSMHVLLCTVFINVYGQGLALRGPLGSMVRAVKGMVDETNQIVQAYVLTIVFFSMSTIGVYWIMMPKEPAIVCTILTVLGLYMWYHFVLRIYNRFQWSAVQETLWNESENSDPAAYLREKTNGSNSVELSEIKTSSEDSTMSGKSKAFFTSLFGGGGNKESLAGQSSAEASAGFSGKKKNNTIDVTYGGYISVKVKDSSTLYQEKWLRRYVVVIGSLLYYYSDKKTFELKPESTLKRRPTDLEAYTLNLVENSLDETAQYILRLTPSDEDDDRKMIEFQCDTVKETQQWIDALVIAIRYGATAAETEKNNITNYNSKRSDNGNMSTARSVFSGSGDNNVDHRAGGHKNMKEDTDTASVTSYTTTSRGGGNK